MANSLVQSTTSGSKRLKASLEDCSSSNDKISNLPDALIHRILSFLSTKQAVATSLLSKRWVSLWVLVPALDLEDSDSCRQDEQAKMKFVRFVDRVLVLNKAGSVERLRLNCNQIYGHSCIDTWICSAVKPGLQEVDISISKEAEEGLLKLPADLFLVKTLTILKLNGGILVDVPDSICFPSLKILHLLRVNYENVESFRWLISGCLSLEELRIDVTIREENMVNVNISTPTLKRLSLSVHNFLLDETKVEINAPSLKYLSLSSFITTAVQCFVKNFPCLLEATIYVSKFSTTQLLGALKSVQYLSLHGELPLVAQACDSFPLFVNLTQLELSRVSWVVLLLFLQNSPKLETLRVQSEILSNDAVGSQLTEPKLIPTCFSSSLVRTSFGGLKFLQDQLKVVEYILKNASVLREMDIHTTDFSSDSKLCILKKLSMFPRSSETCQLFFF